MTHYLAVDLGATSGRTVLATFDGQQIRMREFTRFENPQLPLCGHIFWDIAHLYNEIIKALQKVKAENIHIESIGIDTWGCDFAFFGADGQLLSLPYCYRDPHTDGAPERFFTERIPAREVYERTGIQFMPFNSLFQLDTLRRAECVALKNAEKVLFIPDALIYMLTGEAVCEYTVASTSQMLNPRTGDLDEALLASVGLRREQFGRLVKPGERVGGLTPQVQAATGLGAVPVIAVGSHDTASAVAAVPAEDEHFAYLSCGTWSLLGVESPMPIINTESFDHNFTNEGGLDGTTRFLKNITGLWIYEQCRKEWPVGSEKGKVKSEKWEVPSDVNELNALCLESTCNSIIAPDDPRFAHPASMTAAIREYLTETEQALPETPADYVRVIFRSLAARYREIVDILRKITTIDIQRLHVIGGGSRNQYLMQFAADALGMPVIAGPQEGTALGNALVQVRASGRGDSLKEMRDIIRKSIELKTYMSK
ncbi:MAG: rhamnulokinase [Bacteroidaceae bacterium]|nr:rhamnulokinase [Bacteroidaceae bacterium]